MVVAFSGSGRTCVLPSAKSQGMWHGFLLDIAKVRHKLLARINTSITRMLLLTIISVGGWRRISRCVRRMRAPRTRISASPCNLVARYDHVKLALRGHTQCAMIFDAIRRGFHSMRYVYVPAYGGSENVTY